MTQMRRSRSWASESMALTAISSQVEMSPRNDACWSPREVRNRNPPLSLSPSSREIHSRIENRVPVSGRNSSAERFAVSMARTLSAVFGLSGSTIDCATVPSIASASAVRSVLSRWSTSTLFSVTPFFQNTPAPLEKSWRAAVTQNGSTVSFCCGMRAAAIMSKSRGLRASRKGDQRGARASSGLRSTSRSASKNERV